MVVPRSPDQNAAQFMVRIPLQDLREALPALHSPSLPANLSNGRSCVNNGLELSIPTVPVSAGAPVRGGTASSAH